MKVLCRAMTDEYCDVVWLLFDWDDETQAFVRQYQQLIKDTPLLRDANFLNISLLYWGIAAIEHINDAEADDGLIQAKEKLEEDELTFIILHDSIDTKKGTLREDRLETVLLHIDGKSIYWEVRLKHSDSYIESLSFVVPQR